MSKFYQFPWGSKSRSLIDLDRVAYVECVTNADSKFKYGIRFVFHGIAAAGAGAGAGGAGYEYQTNKYEQTYSLFWEAEETQAKEFKQLMDVMMATQKLAVYPDDYEPRIF